MPDPRLQVVTPTRSVSGEGADLSITPTRTSLAAMRGGLESEEAVGDATNKATATVALSTVPAPGSWRSQQASPSQPSPGPANAESPRAPLQVVRTPSSVHSKQQRLRLPETSTTPNTFSCGSIAEVDELKLRHVSPRSSGSPAVSTAAHGVNFAAAAIAGFDTHASVADATAAAVAAVVTTPQDVCAYAADPMGTDSQTVQFSQVFEDAGQQQDVTNSDLVKIAATEGPATAAAGGSPQMTDQTQAGSATTAGRLSALVGADKSDSAVEGSMGSSDFGAARSTVASRARALNLSSCSVRIAAPRGAAWSRPAEVQSHGAAVFDTKLQEVMRRRKAKADGEESSPDEKTTSSASATSTEGLGPRGGVAMGVGTLRKLNVTSLQGRTVEN